MRSASTAASPPSPGSAFSAQYVGFDLAQYNVSLDAARFLRRAFPGRFRLVVGNSIATLPSWAVAHPASCDVVSVDGGHHFVEALSDLSYARLMARDGAAVVMDDTRCTTWWCKPP